MTYGTLFKEFDKRFKNIGWMGAGGSGLGGRGLLEDEIKSFIKETCLPKEEVKRIEKVTKKLPSRFDCPDCVSLCKEMDRDDVTCAICNGERGYNQALADLLPSIRTDFILKEEVRGVIEVMKNHNEMIEMSGTKYTEGFEKALTDLTTTLFGDNK